MNLALKNLTQKEVTRKEFFVLCGLGIGSVLGLGSMLKLLTGKSLDITNIAPGKKAPGYGSTPYGK